MSDIKDKKLLDIINSDTTLSILLDENIKCTIDEDEELITNLLQKLIISSKNNRIKEYILGNIKKYKSQINKKTKKYRYSSLMIACIISDYEIVEILLKNGANVNQKNLLGEYPLLLACKKSKYDNNFKIIELLIENNSILYQNDSYGDFPLLESCHGFNTKIVELLLKNGCNPNMYDLNCYAPLMCSCQISDYETVKILVKYGADVNFKSYCTVLICSLFNADIKIVKFLLENGAKIDKLFYENRHGLNVLEFYCKKSKNIEDIEVLKILLEYNVFSKNDENYTPMMYLCEYQNKKSIYHHLRLLLDYNTESYNSILRSLDILQKYNKNQNESIILLKSVLGIEKIF